LSLEPEENDDAQFAEQLKKADERGSGVVEVAVSDGSDAMSASDVPRDDVPEDDVP
jgi:hypothetical protein